MTPEEKAADIVAGRKRTKEGIREERDAEIEAEIEALEAEAAKFTDKDRPRDVASRLRKAKKRRINRLYEARKKMTPEEKAADIVAEKKRKREERDAEIDAEIEAEIEAAKAEAAKFTDKDRPQDVASRLSMAKKRRSDRRYAAQKKMTPEEKAADDPERDAGKKRKREERDAEPAMGMF